MYESTHTNIIMYFIQAQKLQFQRKQNRQFSFMRMEGQNSKPVPQIRLTWTHWQCLRFLAQWRTTRTVWGGGWSAHTLHPSTPAPCGPHHQSQSQCRWEAARCCIHSWCVHNTHQCSRLLSANDGWWHRWSKIRRSLRPRLQGCVHNPRDLQNVGWMKIRVTLTINEFVFFTV